MHAWFLKIVSVQTSIMSVCVCMCLPVCVFVHVCVLRLRGKEMDYM